MKMTRRELSAFRQSLPPTPSATNKSVSAPILQGIRAGVRSNPTLLISPVSGGKQDIDKRIDITTTNSTRRRILSFNAQNEGFRIMLNNDLGGGEGYPMLLSALGFAMGFATAGAGYLWTGATMALDLSQQKQAIRVRSGDYIDQIEVFTRDDFDIVHIELIVLVDPYRAKDIHNRSRSQWIIHENRNKVKIDF